jgi:serine/threonine-protein kinase RsbW
MSDDSWTWCTERAIPSETGAGKSFLDELLVNLEAHQWVQHDIFGIHLAMEEALVNAIKHGNRHDVNKRVHICCKLSTQRLWIRIADEGPGFNPESVADCTDLDNLDVPSGRGIMLMRSFMSRVEYNDRGNCVEMEKQRAEEAAS